MSQAFPLAAAPLPSLPQFLFSELAHEGSLGVPLQHFLYVIMSSQYMRQFIKLPTTNTGSNVTTSTTSQKYEDQQMAYLDYLLNQDAFFMHILKILTKLPQIQWFYCTEDYLKMMRGSTGGGGTDSKAKASDTVLPWKLTDQGISMTDEFSSHVQLIDNVSFDSPERFETIKNIYKDYISLNRTPGFILRNIFFNIAVNTISRSYFNPDRLWIRLKPSHLESFYQVLNYRSRDDALVESRTFLLEMAARAREDGAPQYVLSTWQKSCQNPIEIKTLSRCVATLVEQKLIVTVDLYSRSLKRKTKFLFLPRYYAMYCAQQKKKQSAITQQSNNAMPVTAATVASQSAFSQLNNASTQNQTTESSDSSSSFDPSKPIGSMHESTEEGHTQWQYFQENCVSIIEHYLKSLTIPRIFASHLRKKYGFIADGTDFRKRRFERINEKLKASPKLNVFVAPVVLGDKTITQYVYELKSQENEESAAQHEATSGDASDEEHNEVVCLDLPIQTQVYNYIEQCGTAGASSGDIIKNFELQNKFLHRIVNKYPLTSTSTHNRSVHEYKYTCAHAPQRDTALRRLQKKIGKDNITYSSGSGTQRVGETMADRIELTLKKLDEVHALSKKDGYDLLVENGVHSPDRRTISRIFEVCSKYKLAKLYTRALSGIQAEWLIKKDLSSSSPSVKKRMQEYKSFSAQPGTVTFTEKDFDPSVASDYSWRGNSSERPIMRHYLAIQYGYLFAPALRAKEFYFYLLERAEELRLLDGDIDASPFGIELDLFNQVYKGMPIGVLAKVIGITSPDTSDVQRMITERQTYEQYMQLSNRPKLFSTNQGHLNTIHTKLENIIADLVSLKLIKLSADKKHLSLEDHCTIKMPVLWQQSRTYHFTTPETARNFWQLLPKYIRNEEEQVKAGVQQVRTREMFSNKHPRFASANWTEVHKLPAKVYRTLHSKYRRFKQDPTLDTLLAICKSLKHLSIPYPTMLLYFIRHTEAYNHLHRNMNSSVALKHLSTEQSRKQFKNAEKNRRKKKKQRVRKEWDEEGDMRLLVAIGLWIISKTSITDLSQLQWGEIAPIAEETSRERCRRRFKNRLQSIPWVNSALISLLTWKKLDNKPSKEEVEMFREKIQQLFETNRKGMLNSIPGDWTNFVLPATIDEFNRRYDCELLDPEALASAQEEEELHPEQEPHREDIVNSSIEHYVRSVLCTPADVYQPKASHQRLEKLGMGRRTVAAVAQLKQNKILVKNRNTGDRHYQGFMLSRQLNKILQVGWEELFTSSRRIVQTIRHPEELLNSTDDNENSFIQPHAERYGQITGAFQMKLQRPRDGGEVIGILHLMSKDELRLCPQIERIDSEPESRAATEEQDNDNDSDDDEDEDDENANEGESAIMSRLVALRDRNVCEKASGENYIFKSFRNHNLSNVDIHLEMRKEPNPILKDGRAYLSSIPTASLQELLRQSNNNRDNAQVSNAAQNSEQQHTNTDVAPNSESNPHSHHTRRVSRKRRRTPSGTSNSDSSQQGNTHSSGGGRPRLTPPADDDEEGSAVEFVRRSNFVLPDGTAIFVGKSELVPLLQFVKQREKHSDGQQLINIKDLYDEICATHSRGLSRDHLARINEELLDTFDTYIDDFLNFYLVRAVHFKLSGEHYVCHEFADVHTIQPWTASRDETTGKVQINIDSKTPPAPVEPWFMTNGQWNEEFTKKCKRSAINMVSKNPGITEKKLIAFLQPLISEELCAYFLEYLEQSNLLYSQEHAVVRSVSLFSSDTVVEKCFYTRLSSYIRV